MLPHVDSSHSYAALDGWSLLFDRLPILFGISLNVLRLLLQYIQCLRKSGNIEKLRAAREEMNKYFPLTPKMWQEWAKDEISLSMRFVIVFSFLCLPEFIRVMCCLPEVFTSCSLHFRFMEN